MADHNILDKSMRSVFVGNIPYEATEEKLKDIFSEVGPVLSFKLVYDRETGKPKGYGFCEYKDQETALSAMRNLNCYEIGGRTLRVDNACTEKSRLEMQSLMMGMPTSESHYGIAISPEKAPETINNIVSALPPEQLYDLMKQMKDCVQNNPMEARNMLLQNPQLGYALLQAQVIMKIVEPEVAQTMLYPTQQVPLQQMHINNTSRVQPLPQIPNSNIQWRKLNPQTTVTHSQPDNLKWHHMNGASNQLPFLPSQPMVNESPRPYLGYLQPVPMNMGNQSFMDGRSNNGFIPILPQMSVPPPTLIRHTLPQESPLISRPLAQQLLTNYEDSEKAALIMQVLQLTDEQISMLSIDQQQKIIELKEKITHSSQQNE